MASVRHELVRQVGVLPLLALVGMGCREPTPPSYLRVEGSAPSLVSVPQSRAHLVVFWAAWCPPCREETPELRALAADPPEGLAVVVFSHDPNMAAVERFLGGEPEPELHLRLDGDEAVARSFGVDRLPTSLLVVEGRLVARFEGPREWDSRGMRALLQKLIRGNPPSPPSPAR